MDVFYMEIIKLGISGSPLKMLIAWVASVFTFK